MPLKAARQGAREAAAIPLHGALHLPAARLDSYNLDVTYRGRRLAAFTNKRALKLLVEKWRKVARLSGKDPFGKRPSTDLTKKELDAALASGDDVARAIVHGAIEDFAQALALLTERFLTLRSWRDTECIAVGGGLVASTTGLLIVARAKALLHEKHIRIELRPIHHHPHDAALLGAAHMAPAWMLAGHDAMVAADIGGTNVRVGIVQLHLKKAGDLSKACVWKRTVWRHADHAIGRDTLVNTMVKTMKSLIAEAKTEGLRLAPIIGVACPGLIGTDGAIGYGSYVLPGNWQARTFNLPSRLVEAIPAIGHEDSAVLLHNDAVVQGLSEIPFMTHYRHWGIFTVGTGQGSARFSRAKRG